jgi:hypothetical protein
MVFKLNGSCASDYTPTNDPVVLILEDSYYVPNDEGNYTDVNHIDPSFVEPHQMCLIQEDFDNEYIKQRNFFNSPGANDFIPRPQIQNCVPQEVNIKRDGKINGVDDKKEDLTNNKDANTESDLRGLWDPRLSFCRTKKDLKLNQCNDVNNYCRDSGFSDELEETFEETNINKKLFDNQTNKYYQCGIKENEKSVVGRLFLQNTRAKLL